MPIATTVRFAYAALRPLLLHGAWRTPCTVVNVVGRWATFGYFLRVISNPGTAPAPVAALSQCRL